MAKVAFEVRISGHVQGVSFRFYTREQALSEGVNGWVRNLPDGDVEAWIQGDPDAVERLMTWLHSGPPQARVLAVRAEPREPDPNAGAFEIRR